MVPMSPCSGLGLFPPPNAFILRIHPVYSSASIIPPASLRIDLRLVSARPADAQTSSAKSCRLMLAQAQASLAKHGGH